MYGDKCENLIHYEKAVLSPAVLRNIITAVLFNLLKNIEKEKDFLNYFLKYLLIPNSGKAHKQKI